MQRRSFQRSPRGQEMEEWSGGSSPIQINRGQRSTTSSIWPQRERDEGKTFLLKWHGRCSPSCDAYYSKSTLIALVGLQIFSIISIKYLQKFPYSLRCELYRDWMSFTVPFYSWWKWQQHRNNVSASPAIFLHWYYIITILRHWLNGSSILVVFTSSTCIVYTICLIIG